MGRAGITVEREAELGLAGVTGVDVAGLVELRVHGVGGTPPAAMLDDPSPRQVAGDRIAGFYRGATSSRASGGTMAS